MPTNHLRVTTANARGTYQATLERSSIDPPKLAAHGVAALLAACCSRQLRGQAVGVLINRCAWCGWGCRRHSGYCTKVLPTDALGSTDPVLATMEMGVVLLK